jgi:hypothetical protein
METAEKPLWVMLLIIKMCKAIDEGFGGDSGW